MPNTYAEVPVKPFLTQLISDYESTTSRLSFVKELVAKMEFWKKNGFTDRFDEGFSQLAEIMKLDIPQSTIMIKVSKVFENKDTGSTRRII